MSLTIKTESHENVEGGFFSVYTGAFRFGDYAFPTQNLHKMIKHFAEKPSSFALNLTSFGEETFWNNTDKFFEEILNSVFENTSSLLPELAEYELDRIINSKQGKSSLSDINAEIVPIRINNEETEISFGRYKLDKNNFNGLTKYVVEGGWFGWNNGDYPESAQQAIESIKNSKRPLYEGLKF